MSSKTALPFCNSRNTSLLYEIQIRAEVKANNSKVSTGNILNFYLAKNKKHISDFRDNNIVV